MEMIDYELISDEIIGLKLLNKSSGDEEKGRSPEYKFQIQLLSENVGIGHLNVRFGNNEKLEKYIGHIGYGVDELYRGNKYSFRACQLAKKVLKDHSVKRVIITCNPDNYSSRNICEKLGANLIEIVDVPKDFDIYSLSESQKCRYEWKLEE